MNKAVMENLLEYKVGQVWQREPASCEPNGSMWKVVALDAKVVLARRIAGSKDIGQLVQFKRADNKYAEVWLSNTERTRLSKLIKDVPCECELEDENDDDGSYDDSDDEGYF